MWQACGFVLATAALVPAAPYQDARLKDLGVEMVLNTPGRTGACDVVRFTADGAHLLAAGDDKVVRVWDVGPTGLTPAAVPVLRWSMFREHRGGIYALDIAPDPKDKAAFRVAVAGAGLRAGSAAVLSSRGEVLYGMPPFSVGKQLEEGRTLQAVWSVAFSPSGEEVALGGSDGSIWLWDLGKKAVRRLGLHPKREGQKGSLNEVRLVTYLDGRRLISVAADGRVLQWDPTAAAGKATEIFRFTQAKNLECVALDRTKQWLAAGGQTFAEGEQSSSVELRSLDGSKYKALTLPRRNFPRNLAFDAASKRLAVGSYITADPNEAGSKGFYLLLGGNTYLFDLAEDQPKPTLGPAASYYVDAVAFHPDGNRLAVSGGDNHEVALWDLRKPGNGPQSLVTGPGHGLWGVGVSKDLRHLGYRDQRTPKPDHPNHLGRGPWQVFDLKERRLATPDEAKAFEPVQPIDTADGWTVVPDNLNGRIWYVEKGGVRQQVPLISMDKFPRCFTFLKADGERPTRLVVGHIWGMSVFALGDGPPKLVRKFAGHQGEVMAVAPSDDGKFLVTASRDQTVALWSLLPQEHQGELGARFEAKGDRLVVTDVAAGSPAWEARLQTGDEITNFASNADWIKGGPDKWLPILQDPPPGQECGFLFDRGGAPFATLTTVRQRPLARFFPMDNREWVLWRYYDFYYDCSTNGDRFVAWQLSGDVDTTPRFDPIERYRKRFFKPEKVAALFTDLRTSPERVSLLDIEPPRVTAVATPETVVAGAVRLSITARPAGDMAEQQLKQVNLWLNGAIIQEWLIDAAKEPSFLTTYDLPVGQLRQGVNLLTVQAYNQAEVRHQVQVTVNYDKQPAPGRLFALVIGVGDYQKSDAKLANLSANKDALAVKELLAAQGKLFTATDIVTLRDTEASRERILDETTRLAKVVRPDDTFVMFMGGHGASGQEINTEAGKRGANLKRIAPHLFVFCTHDFAINEALTTGLPSEDLYREIRRFNCRTVVLLDTCHSGTVIEDPIRQLTPDGVGPVILSACEPREPAAEDRLLGLQYAEGKADGLFTIALILALKREFARADADHNQILTATELSDYLKQRVPKLLRTRTTKGEDQHPTVLLPDLERYLPVAANLKK